MTVMSENGFIVITGRMGRVYLGAAGTSKRIDSSLQFV
jgi:hypothetical protein